MVRQTPQQDRNSSLDFAQRRSKPSLIVRCGGDTMKTLAISIVLALGLSAPALAQTANPPADSPPANLVQSAPDTTPIDVLIDEATTQEDRAMLLRRCAGPPPRPIAQDATKQPPASAPVVVAGGESSGG
jgi:hypothetical protein